MRLVNDQQEVLHSQYEAWSPPEVESESSAESVD